MIKILFVCLGNICRSPLAEAIFKHKVRELRLERHFDADSAGTGRYHIGENPDPRSIEVAQKHGVPISHKGRQLTITDGNEFDYILVMDNANFRDSIHILNQKPEGLMKIRDFDSQEKGTDVPDPYWDGQDGFENVFTMLDRSMDELLLFLKKKHDL